MSLTALLRWLPLVTLLAMMFAAKVRAAIMQRRGLRVIVVDWDRPRRDLLYDTLVIAVALFWIYLLLAEAWPFSLSWLPDWLTTRLVDATPVKTLGAVLVLAAPLLFAAALRALGESWRMGIDREQPGPLVASGLYAWSRNPNLRGILSGDHRRVPDPWPRHRSVVRCSTHAADPRRRPPRGAVPGRTIWRRIPQLPPASRSVFVMAVML